MPAPSIDYSCAHCGHSQTYQLVPEVAPAAGAHAAPREIPSIDLRCLRCGTSQTYKLVPESGHTVSSDQ
jgi:uncharacterized Zn finger protein